MSTMFALFPFLLKLYADSGYQGPKFRQGLQRVCRQINVEIVKRSDVSKFVVLPKRWVVEGTIADSAIRQNSTLLISQGNFSDLKTYRFADYRY